MPKKSTELEGAKAEVVGRKSSPQPNRVGKKPVVSYVPRDDADRFHALLKARGTTAQDFFAQIVQNELAAAAGPEASIGLSMPSWSAFAPRSARSSSAEPSPSS